jgi:hypothetical protein
MSKDAARSVHESNIRQATVPRSQEIWQSIRHHWAAAFAAKQVADATGKLS